MFLSYSAIFAGCQIAMISNLTIAYPWWFLLLAIFTGLLYAGILYLWNKKLKFHLLIQIILFALRFILISLLTFLLLSPFIKSKKRYTEKPIIILGVDNSKSVVLGKDSTYYTGGFVQEMNDLENQLSQSYRVDKVFFGSGIQILDQPDFSDQATNYSLFFKEVSETYSGLNLGTIILAGDGINNRGIDPEFSAESISVPIYAIALGDTLQRQDVKINDARFNSIVYLDDEFPIEVNVSANGFKGEKINAEVYAFGRKQGGQQIDVKSDQFSKSLVFKIKAQKTGKQRIQILLSSLEGELNEENNRRNIFINVLDNRQKILILANSPHPDIAAIKSSFSLNKNYEIETQFINSFNADLNSFDLVVLHQLPSKKNPAQQIINQLKTNKTPILYIAGKQSNFSRLSNQFEGFELSSVVNNFEESRLVSVSNFTLFSFSREMAQQLEDLPPLITFFGSYAESLNANVFGYQKINRLKTTLPLIVFHENQDAKSAAILGEGLWIWRMHSFLQYQNTNAFDTFMWKSAQFLMARNDKRLFKIISKDNYGSNEKVFIQAELYNSAYELINEPDVNIRITNDKKEQFNYVFSPEGNAYSLDLERMPVGIYSYSAFTKLGGKTLTDAGEFIVSGQLLESRRLNADHGLLYRIAKNSGGEMVYPVEIMQLPEILQNRTDLKSRIYFEEKYTGLHDLWWIIGLALFLLSLEWFLRKYFGSY